jgi:hypothetical protein
VEKAGKEGRETIKEIDKVLDHLEGRLDRVTAAIRQVAVQGKALELVMPEDGTDRTGSRDILEELETPALQSSVEEHRIVDIEPRTGAPGLETPHMEGDPSPNSAELGDKREEKNEWPSLVDQRRRAEEEYDKLRGLSHGCRQSWDLRMREEKGPGRKINGLFHWISEDSLVLHEMAKNAGLEGHGLRRRVDTLSCGVWNLHVHIGSRSKTRKVRPHTWKPDG